MPKNHSMQSKISLRLPCDIKAAWQAAAQEAGLCLGDWIRAQISFDGVKPIITHKPTPRKAPDLKRRVFKSVDPELILQVAKIGNNLNQIARGINRSGLAVLDQFQLLEQLLLIEQALHQLIARHAARDSSHHDCALDQEDGSAH